MTLRAVEKALKDYSRITGQADDAFAELASIRKAAKIIAKATEQGWPTTPMGSLNLQHSFELLGAIAKEEP